MGLSKNRQLSNLLDKDSGLVKSTLSDSDQIVASGSKGIASTSAGTTVYATLANLPGSATTGDQAFVSSNNGLYIYNGSGWYKVALVNATPYWDTEASASYTFTVDTAITITLLAGDSDGHSITYTATPDSDANLFITITKDSDNGRIFTLTPDSENEAPANSNTGNITFKASDGISFASTVSSFTLTFSTTVDNSAETVMLMKATGSGKAHENISYQYGSDASLDIVGFTTTTGTPVTSSFSPYREGGYSTYFDGSGDYIKIGANADPVNWLKNTPGVGTFEAWIYMTAQRTTGSYYWPSVFAIGATWWNFGVEGDQLQIYYYDGAQQYVTPSSSTISLYTWHHVAFSNDSSNNLRIFIDGTLVHTESFAGTSWSTGSGGNDLYIGKEGFNANSNFPGYIRDARITSGVARYTASFTAPTEPLTSDSNTEALLCHLPYFVDGSSNSLALTIGGNTSTKPFGPYDYNPHVHNGGVTSDVGSTFLSTASDGMAETTNHQTISNFGSGDFTIECWYYPTGLTNYQTLYSGRTNTSTYGQLIWFIGSAGNFIAYASSTGSSWDVISVSGTTIKVNDYAWNHIAFVRNGSNFKVYVNGVGETIATSSSTLVANTLLQIGYENTNANSEAPGYISDYRIVKGTAVYTSNFTPTTEPLTWVTNTTLLLNNKYDTYIYDAAAANALKLNSDAQSSTITRKFTTSSSVLINGTDDRVTIENLGLGGDMTFEGWFMQTTATGANYRTLLEASTYTGSTPFGLFTYNTQVQLWGLQNGVQITGSFTQNTWHHVAVVRNSGTWTLYIDGTSQGTNTNNGTYTFADTTDWNLGAQGSNASDFIGYLQDWRFSNRAVYTTNFTPPTAEFEL